ncbi:MAG TPA: substrate-binding domain-containing protein, partial [Fervidobacterium sp.]|nr:substrate-binding domain-containing protein [Fervidobacterium sp.]
VGEDVGLVGFDDIQLAEYVSPPLTTVRQPMREMGTLAAQQIFHSINGIFPKECIFLDTQLIIRESCGWRKRKLS